MEDRTPQSVREKGEEGGQKQKTFNRQDKIKRCRAIEWRAKLRNPMRFERREGREGS